MNRVTVGLSTAAILALISLAACGPQPAAPSNGAAANAPTSANAPAPASSNTSLSNAAPAAPAADAQADAADPCGNLATQLDMNGCEANRAAQADAALTAVYGQFSPKSADLVAAECAWVAYRDAECAFAGDAVQGGSMQPMVVSACKATLTRQRVRVLTADLAALQPQG
jgi:uncharacterized protein YecT (DUF1311 family)